MQNHATEPMHIGTVIDMVIPRFDHSQTPVIQSNDTGMTSIIPAQTPVTSPTHTGLSTKQAQVLDILLKNATSSTNYASIAVAVGISKSAARSAVSQLVAKDFIKKPETVRDGVFQGFAYGITNAKCQQFLAAGGASNEKYLSSPNILTPPIQTVCSPSDPPHTHSSRSDNDNTLTTETIDLREPELLWWSDQGLTEKQITSWINEFRIKPEELAQSLRFARFDAVENEVMSNGKPIENAKNWIYVILKRAGTYPRPKNYKSIIELRADELEEQVRIDNIARDKIKNLEFETKFSDFMKNRESSLFQELYNSLNDFEKDNSFVGEIALKELFKERYEMGTTGVNS